MPVHFSLIGSCSVWGGKKDRQMIKRDFKRKSTFVGKSDSIIALIKSSKDVYVKKLLA